MTTLIVAFLNLTNAPKSEGKYEYCSALNVGAENSRKLFFHCRIVVLRYEGRHTWTTVPSYTTVVHFCRSNSYLLYWNTSDTPDTSKLECNGRVLA
jgi:hypothetical protein